MREADGVVIFKEWLPDQHDLDNPGLIEANNTIPVRRRYKHFRPLVGRGASGVAETFNSAFRAETNAGGGWVLGGTQSRLYRAQGSAAAFTTNSATLSASSWRFVQFEDIVVAALGASNVPLQWTVGSAAGAITLAAAGTAPPADVVGVINQFVLLNDASQQNLLRWSSIGDPTDWPTPGSATAIARQSGEEELPAELGGIKGIFGNDQYGIVFQESGIHRVTYVGGDVVFQFDKISDGIGLAFMHAAVQVGGVVYFATRSGFYATDGVNVRSIGDGKVNKWFYDMHSFAITPLRVQANVDWDSGNVCWSAPVSAGAASETKLIFYNPVEDRFTNATQTVRALVYGGGQHFAYTYGHEGITDGNQVGEFDGTAGTAIFITGEVEFSRGGYSRVSGVKPLVDVTANAVTVAIGTRNDQQATPTFTAETTANSRSGFADFRSEAKYHRARLTITGTFNGAQGLEFIADASGPV